MSGALQPAGACETIRERVPEYALLPPGTKGYLQEKIEFALKAPRIVSIVLPDGTIGNRLLKQLAMTLAIRRDEAAANYYWQYKAEVSFDMAPSIATGGIAAPIPYLSADKTQGPGRRHSLNPFPPGMKPGLLRRPDVIIVKNPMDRWPGRGNVDLDGATHIDNMLRLVEVKFPGDGWGIGQEGAYQTIAGDYKTRMTVIDVSDCNGELKKVPVPVPVPAPKTENETQRQRVPLRTVPAIPQHAWYEDWWTWAEQHGEEAEQAVAAMWDATKRGYAYLSAETSAFLHQHAPWMFTAGHWIADKTSQAWVWVDEKGQELYRYTAAQLKAGWQEIVRATDMTWELLKQVDWGHVGMTILKGLAAVVLVIAAVAVVIIFGAELLAILAALCAIIAEGGAAVLAVMLGVQALEGAG
ncbi:VRR-NUC domain-containing protein [Paraburkholderia sp.]|uniref:VRR-NUC domain-containing protein n=1 Tax=Paraburkholderia sp. TaxID=1926495 RepID=UPI003D6E63C3